MLSMQDDPRYVREAFSVGATGYLLKEAADKDLIQAVREVAAGGLRPSDARCPARAGGSRRNPPGDERPALRDREREVLRLLALGHTNQEIAKLLFLSIRTAETHRAHVMQKLDLGTRAELCYALASGLMDE